MAAQKNKGNVIANTPVIEKTPVIANAVKQSHDANDNNKQIASSLAMTHARAPKLRFKEFEGEWEIIKFDKYCDFQQGVQVDVDLQKTEPFEDYIRFLRIENYTQESNDFRFIPNIYNESKIINENDIVVVRYGATAGFIGRGKKGVLANNLFKIIPDKSFFDNEYLYHYLKSYKAFHFFQTEMSGGAMPALSFGIVKALKVPISDLVEQQKIANFLTAVDTKLQQLTTKKERLAQYKKGVMQQLFSQQLRFKPDVIARTQDDAISPNETQFPDWEEKRLGEVFKIFNGYAFSSKDSTSEGVLWVKIADVGIQEMKNDSISFLPYSFLEKHKKFILEKGDYILALTRPILNGKLKIARVNEFFSNSLLNQRVGKIVTENNKDFVYFLLQQDFLIKSIENNIAGSDPPNLSPSEINNLKVMIPELKEQQKIATYLSAIDKKIEAVQTQITKTQAFKKGLLQSMFV